MVKLLAFDTAAGACSAALWVDGRIQAHESAEMTRGHAERLMPMIAAVVDQAGLAFGDLDAYAVTVGPGAFTGLRVGLAAARGLALASDRPVLGVGTLEALAAAVPEAERRDRRILAALDSKRDDVFFQFFTADLTPDGAPAVGSVDKAAAALGAGLAVPAIIVGDGAKLLRDAVAPDGDIVFSAAPPWPDAACVAALAARRWQGLSAAERRALPPPSPLYLRPPAAKLPRAGGRLRP